MRTRALPALLAALLVSCTDDGATAPLRVSTGEVSPPPGSAAISTARGLVEVRGSVQATCAPYEITPTVARTGTLVEVILTGRVAGNACPADIAWTKGIAVRVEGVAPGRHQVRVVHTTDLGGTRQMLLDTLVVVP